jgi:3-deoxy-manno-octulosonate cytidylyltransferase (CMP-KDO synthetase)
LNKPICIIPARMGSSRFPGKSLEPLLGLPLVLHVYERCLLYKDFSDVFVATCDTEIMEAVKAHGGKAVMTADTHDRCTDRVEECVQNAIEELADDAVITMVQGDEVLVTPEMISAVNSAQQETGDAVVNLGSRLYKTDDQESTDTVKIVAGLSGYALYLSRSVIPTSTRDKNIPIYQQTGIMSFTWKFLKTFSSLPQTPLEQAESVDMLRVVENNLPLKVVFTEKETLGVDTPDDLKNGELRLTDDPTTKLYMDLP